MRKLKTNHKYPETQLTAAIDESVEAAMALGISESTLSAMLRQRMQVKQRRNIVILHRTMHRIAHNFEAGP